MVQSAESAPDAPDTDIAANATRSARFTGGIKHPENSLQKPLQDARNPEEPLLKKCRRRESNPHFQNWKADFKSAASTNSATAATASLGGRRILAPIHHSRHREKPHGAFFPENAKGHSVFQSLRPSISPSLCPALRKNTRRAELIVDIVAGSRIEPKSLSQLTEIVGLGLLVDLNAHH